MPFLQLLAEAVLYYVACLFMARKREDAPGLVRVLVTVFLLAVVSGGLKYAIGDFWLTSAAVFLVNFLILLIGLGIGFVRTIFAAVIVLLLRMLMERVFSIGGGPELFS